MLRDAGQSGRSLRYFLLRQCTELAQRLTCSLESDVQQEESASPGVNAVPSSPTDSKTQTEESSRVLEAKEASLQGGGGQDNAYMREVRNQALEVFEGRHIGGEDYVALWMDATSVYGRSLLLCMAVTAEGYRHMLGFTESTVQDTGAVRQLLQGLCERGLCVDRGLLCITSGQAGLTRVLGQSLGMHVCLQHCQMAKRERVVSYLADEDQRRVKGAISRAYQLPDRQEAHSSLMRIHAELQRCNRSAAQWLLQDLDRTLTLHGTGLYEMLSPSLRSTRCLMHTSHRLVKQLRGLRHWYPPQERRAQLALLLLEMESRMRRLEHASKLLPMRSALFADEVSEQQA